MSQNTFTIDTKNFIVGMGDKTINVFAKSTEEAIELAKEFFKPSKNSFQLIWAQRKDDQPKYTRIR